MKIKFYLFFAVAYICTSVNSFSQHTDPAILSAGGGIAAINNISLEWTLGEVATESIQSATALYTQGFHQPILRVEKNMFAHQAFSSEKIGVYPNPATSAINIVLGFTPQTNLSVSLTDVHGRLLLKKQIPSNDRSLKLDVTPYAKGTYLLTVSNASGTIFQSYKIIKA